MRPLFEEFGSVLEVALIKDRATGAQRGNTPMTAQSGGIAELAWADGHRSAGMELGRRGQAAVS